MKRRRLLLAIIFTFPLLGQPANEDCDPACQDDLSAVREATSAYHDESLALAGGYGLGSVCIASADGLGGAGYHYINRQRVDQAVSLTAPEILLYEPQKDGSRKLVGVEYYVPVYSGGTVWRGGPTGLTPPPSIDNPPPVLFGRTMDGPMHGHLPGQPWHYDLHVWIWRHNPQGMFANFNPRVSCQYGSVYYVGD